MIFKKFQSGNLCPLVDMLYPLALHIFTLLVSLSFKQEASRGIEDVIAMPRKMSMNYSLIILPSPGPGTLKCSDPSATYIY
jgi:hypothetical protein